MINIQEIYYADQFEDNLFKVEVRYLEILIHAKLKLLKNTKSRRIRLITKSDVSYY